jgi:hypothetical protein
VFCEWVVLWFVGVCECVCAVHTLLSESVIVVPWMRAVCCVRVCESVVQSKGEPFVRLCMRVWVLAVWRAKDSGVVTTAAQAIDCCRVETTVMIDTAADVEIVRAVRCRC